MPLDVMHHTDFHGRRDEDPHEWLSSFRKVAEVNNWQDARKLEIVPIYLKDAAARWYTDWTIINGSAANLVWDGGAGSFTFSFLRKFQTETKLAVYQEKFDILTQG